VAGEAGDVADDQTKIEPPSCWLPRRRRKVHGNARPSARREAKELRANADDLGFRPVDVIGDYSRPVHAIGFRHQHLDVLPRPRRGITNNFTRRIEHQHDAARIDQIAPSTAVSIQAASPALSRSARSADLRSVIVGGWAMPTEAKIEPRLDAWLADGKIHGKGRASRGATEFAAKPMILRLRQSR